MAARSRSAARLAGRIFLKWRKASKKREKGEGFCPECGIRGAHALNCSDRPRDKVTCRDCGATFVPTSSQCPYCHGPWQGIERSAARERQATACARAIADIAALVACFVADRPAEGEYGVWCERFGEMRDCSECRCGCPELAAKPRRQRSIPTKLQVNTYPGWFA